MKDFFSKLLDVLGIGCKHENAGIVPTDGGMQFKCVDCQHTGPVIEIKDRVTHRMVRAVAAE